MKLKHLRFLVAVVESGGIVKAARRMHVSQPALSAGIKQLEQELGSQLFERRAGHRGVVPTACAHDFYERAASILQQCEAAITAFRSQNQDMPELRIGVIPTLHHDQVGTLINSIASQRYGWRIHVTEGSPAKLQALLRAGKLDVAWTAIERAKDAYLQARERFGVFASRSHPLVSGGGGTLGVSDLNGQPFILRGSCELQAGQLRAAGLLFRVVAKAERDELAFALAARGIGLVLAPVGLASGVVVELPVYDLKLERTLGFQWAERAPKKIRDAIIEASHCL